MIGFLGGTGPEGRSLALRMALAGNKVVIGSRDAERAQEIARKVEARAETGQVVGATNEEVAVQSEIVFITVPYEGQSALLGPLKSALADKVVVDTVAPISYEEGVFRSLLVPEGSAAEQAQELLPDSQVVAAFQNVSAVDLWKPDKTIEGDVVVCGDDVAAKQRVMVLAEQIKQIRAVDGGGLTSSRYVEEITALLLGINRIYKAHTMIRIVGM